MDLRLKKDVKNKNSNTSDLSNAECVLLLQYQVS